MSNGKAKGSEFERDIAKFLTKWVTGQEKPYVFWRTPSSGALATISEENKELSGDIHAVRPEGTFLTDKFSIELKNGYPQANFHQHLKKLKKPHPIKEFWIQCMNGAKPNKYAMLIYKKKGMCPMLGLEANVFIDFIESLNLPYLKLKFNDSLNDVIFLDMEGFFEVVTPEMIKNIK